MSRLKLTGLILAFAILVFALAAKVIGGVVAVGIMLPMLTVMLMALTVIDIAAYKTNKNKKCVSRTSELVRIVSLTVLSVIMLAAAIIYYVI